MAHVKALLEGYKRFYAKHFQEDKALYADLAEHGQTPKTLVIACSDSRVDPSILFDANPGDIFVVRNVANLVPPYQPAGESYHGTSAALEFGVNHLKVKHIVVLGHSGCAGIRATFEPVKPASDEFSFISSWVDIAGGARARTMQRCAHSNEDKFSVCEKESIITSIENLLTFPWIRDKVERDTIALHGWYFELASGKLHLLSDAHKFEEAEVA